MNETKTETVRLEAESNEQLISMVNEFVGAMGEERVHLIRYSGLLRTADIVYEV